MFQRPKKAPQFADLKNILANTQLDNATYQLLQVLIDRLAQYQNVIAEQIAEIIETASKNQGNGGSSSIKPHAPTHRAGGTDPVQITQSQVDGLTTDLASKVSNTDPRLSDARTPTAHASTHRPGASDSLLNNAWTDQANIFIANQQFNAGHTIENNNPTQHFNVISAPADQMRWRMGAGPDKFILTAINDGYSNSRDAIVVSRAGYVPNNTLINTPLNVAGSAVATGLVQGSQIKTDGSINECAYFIAPGYARTHWRNNGQAVGQQTWVIINYAGRLSILPTTDDIGQTPPSNDWNYALSIDHNGVVYTGAGGFSPSRIIQDNTKALTYGSFNPTLGALVSNLVSVNCGYNCVFMRVGNVVTVSGQFDAQASAAGTLCQFTMSLPIPTVGVGWGVLSSQSGVTGYITGGGSISIITVRWIANNTGNIGHWYTYTYHIG